MNEVSAADLRFRDDVESCTLGADDFPHEQHVRLAWIYLKTLPAAAAERTCGDTISRFAAHHGAPGKYHETMTRAFVRIVRHFLRDAPPGEDWAGFRRRVPALFDDARALLESHYSPDVLAGDDARTGYVDPDREPF